MLSAGSAGRGWNGFWFSTLAAGLQGAKTESDWGCEWAATDVIDGWKTMQRTVRSQAMVGKTSWMRKFVLAGVAGALLGPGLSAADRDYEFAEKLLIEFNMEQLADEQIASMEKVATPAGQFDWKLATAMRMINQAESGKLTPEASADKMAAAKKLLDDICAAEEAKAFSHFESATKMRDSLVTRNIDLLITAAMEMERDDPVKAQAKREQAAAEYDKLFQAAKAEMVATHEKFYPAIVGMNKWFEDHERDENEVPLPGDIRRKVVEAWTNIMPATNRWADYGLRAMKYYNKTHARRTEINKELIEYFTKKVDEEYESNELVCMTLNEFMGESVGYAGDSAKMSEYFENVFGVQDSSYPEGVARRLVQDLKKRAAFFMVSLNMDNKKYQEVIEKIERILFDTQGIKKTDMGKQLTFDLAKAKCLVQPGADYEEAKQLLVELMDSMADNDPWMNNARRALSEVIDIAMQHGQYLSMPGKRWYDAGRGMFMLASMADQQAKALADEGKISDAAKKAEEARPLFFTAIKFYRSAISAQRQGSESLAERLEIESNCWNEMAFAYLRLKLNYESMLSFKGLVESFRPESLKALIAASRNPADRNLLSKPSEEQAKVLAEVNKKITEAQKNMMQIAGVIYGETSTSYNREIKAEIIKYVQGDDEGGPADLGEGTRAPEFQASQLKYDTATGSKADGAQYRSEGNTKRAQEEFQKAFASFIDAGKSFQAIAKSSQAYESALYMAAASYYQAYLMYAQNTIATAKPEERKSKLEEIGPKVIEAYENYVKYVDSAAAKSAVLTEADLQRRVRFKAAAYGTTPSVLMYLERYDEALAKIEAFFKFSRENPGIVEPKTLDGVNWTKYLVYFKKFQSLPTEAGKITIESLNEMNTVIKECRDMAERFDKGSRRLNQSAGTISMMAGNASKACDLFASGDREKGDQSAGLKANFNRLSATWFSTYIEGRNADEVSIDNYFEAAERFKSAGMTDEAAGMYRRILDLFDKEQKGQRIPNQVLIEEMFKPMWVRSAEKPGTPYLKLRNKVTSTEVERIKQLHRELLDLMVDDDVNRTKAGDERWDIKDENSVAARAVLKQIREAVKPLAEKNNMKPEELCESMTVTSIADAPPGPWKDKIDGEVVSYLTAAEREIEFRDLLYGVRYEYMTNLIAMLEKIPVGEERVEAAKKASEEMDIFTDIYGQGGVRVKMTQADMWMLTGVTENYGKALEMYFDVRRSQQPNTLMYNRCTAGMMKCFYHTGRVDKADEYMNNFCLTLTPPKIREFFPDFDKYKGLLEQAGKTYREPQRHFEGVEEWDYRQRTREEEALAQMERTKKYNLDSGLGWNERQEKERLDMKAKVLEQYKQIGLDENGKRIKNAPAPAPTPAPAPAPAATPAPAGGAQ